MTLGASGAGGVPGFADSLVALMSEGGSLLREREELILEHARLTAQHADDEDPELSRLLEALTEVEALNAERAELRAARGLPCDSDDLEALERLLPLLAEADALRRERQQLSGERQLVAEEEDVELELFEAVKGVALENESLKAEIHDLQAQIARLRSRSSEQRDALPMLHRLDPVPRVIAPSPPPELHSSGPQVLVHDRPKQREAPGAFAKAELPQDLRNLQEIIDRLQTENAELKSHIQTIEAPGFAPDLQSSVEEAAVAVGDVPEAPPLPPEQEQVEEMPEAPSDEAAKLPKNVKDLRAMATDGQTKVSIQEKAEIKCVEPRKALGFKSRVRPKEEVDRPRPPPEELLKQAGIPLTTEAMLAQLISPKKGKKVMLPRTLSLTPEDPNARALERQKAMGKLLRVNMELGKCRDFVSPRGSERSGSPVLSPSRMTDADLATQEQAMKGALHTLFRCFGK